MLEGCQIVRSPEEALCDPALVVDGCVVEVDDPDIGPIRHIGLLSDFAPTAGTLAVLGETFGRSDWRELRRRIGLVGPAVAAMIAKNGSANRYARNTASPP